MIKAIETSYKGYKFRSRLEARYALFFDTLGIKWEYEPEGFELPGGVRYLPDFKVFYSPADDHYFWFEVKGPKATKPEKDKCQLLADATDKFCFIASGTMDVPQISEGRKGAVIYHGAVINEFSPSSAVLSPKPFPKDLQELNNSLLCGFYETKDGDFKLDHLYLEDIVEFSEKTCTGAITKVTDDFRFLPGLNLGQGRKYRSNRLQKAYAAARSARFEFGENGAPHK